jgi:hypothetical protein
VAIRIGITGVFFSGRPAKQGSTKLETDEENG